jgi:hypothetical protein
VGPLHRSLSRNFGRGAAKHGDDGKYQRILSPSPPVFCSFFRFGFASKFAHRTSGKWLVQYRRLAAACMSLMSKSYATRKPPIHGGSSWEQFPPVSIAKVCLCPPSILYSILHSHSPSPLLLLSFSSLLLSFSFSLLFLLKNSRFPRVKTMGRHRGLVGLHCWHWGEMSQLCQKLTLRLRVWNRRHDIHLTRSGPAPHRILREWTKSRSCIRGCEGSCSFRCFVDRSQLGSLTRAVCGTWLGSSDLGNEIHIECVSKITLTSRAGIRPSKAQQLWFLPDMSGC